MKIFTLYQDGTPVDRQMVYGNDDAACPDGWTDTTHDPSIVPIAPVPQTVSAAQAWAVLSQMPHPGGGTMWDAADAATLAAGGATRAYWLRNPTFERDSQSLNAMASSIGLTDAQVDSLFIAAAQITA